VTVDLFGLGLVLLVDCDPLVQINLRMANERYFRQHAEIKSMIKMFIETCLKEKPQDTVGFAANFFCDHLLAKKVEDYNTRANF